MEEGPGAGKDVQWPTGIGAKGNDGVAGATKQTKGAVGYVESPVRRQSGLTSASLKNADGNFVQAPPSASRGADAVASSGVGQPTGADHQRRRANTYPIASYTYLLVYVAQEDQAKGQALVAITYWALTDGQALENDLGYAPLPASVSRRRSRRSTRSLRGAPIWPCSGSPSQPPLPGEAILCFGAGSSRRASPGGPAVVP